MATTTNYGWTTPDDTALVKDGASAIRSLGTAIDTTVFNNAGAAIAKTLIDAKGDLIVGSAADTAARLAVGTNGYTLVADSAEATGLKWQAASSGGMTLINTGGTALSGSSTTISSIPATYTNLYVVIILSDPQDDGGGLLMRFNGDDTANRHARVTGGFSGGNVTFNQTAGQLTYSQDNGTPNGIVIVEIPFYANTSIWKYFRSSGVVNSYLDQAKAEFTTTVCAYNQTGAVTSLEFFFNGGVIASGGTIYVYGVK